MDLNSIINSPGMWIASGIMVFVVAAQSCIYLRAAFKEAERLNIPKSKCFAGMRSAVITAIGPSMSPVIVLFALVAILGAPTTWMRLNDIGSARAELAMVTLASQLLGVDPQGATFDLTAYTYSLWGMALNNVGWMVVTLLLTHRMSKMVMRLNKKYNPDWIKLLMSGATVGLFAFLLSGQLINASTDKWYSAFFAAISMLVISRVLKKYQRLQELGLGISMLIGMFAATAITM